jgi:hypothetical protein
MTVRLRTLILPLIVLFTMCLWAVKSASGGDPVTIRVLDPQGLEVGVFTFPDRDDLGTGTFYSSIPPGALAGDPFVRVSAAAPAEGTPGELQITAATSVSKRLVTVELRRLPGAEPVSRAAVSLPQHFDPTQRHALEVAFAKWNVSGVTMDGVALSPKGVR